MSQYLILERVRILRSISRTLYNQQTVMSHRRIFRNAAWSTIASLRLYW